MIGEIVDAVGLALKEAFGNNYKVYTEETGKGMDAPCFFVFCSAPRNSGQIPSASSIFHLR